MDTLAELGAVAKRQDQWKVDKPNQSQKAGALQGAGAVGLGGGLLAGGIPGAKVSGSAKWTKASGMKGGIFGFREAMHRDAARRFQLRNRGVKPEGWYSDQFARSANSGKIAPEKHVIRTMGRARKASYAATALGAGALGAGAYLQRRSEDKDMGRVRKDSWKRRHEDRRAGRYAGAGATAAVGGAGVGHWLSGQSKKWGDEANRSLGAARAHVPGLPATKPIPWHKAWDYKDKIDAAGADAARKAGDLHGRAAQAKYFSRAYKWNAKGVKSAGLAGVGAMGAAGAIHRNERKRREAERARRRR